jgi:hypothetical protein
MTLEQKIDVLDKLECDGSVVFEGKFVSVTLLLELWNEVKQPLGLVLKQVHWTVPVYSSKNEHSQ